MQLSVPGLGLLMVTMAYSQTTCQKKGDGISYYIYNSTVDVRAFYCDYGEKNNCHDPNSAAIKKIFSSSDIDYCRWFLRKWIDKIFGTRKDKLCEIPAQANLLENTISFAGGIRCTFSKGSCYNSKILKHLYWPADICKNLILLQKNNFTVCTVPGNRSKCIKADHISLVLTENIAVCGTEFWKTNYEGVVASTSIARNSRRRGNFTSIRSDLENFCQTGKKTTINPTFGQSTTTEPKPKTWHIYKYPINVTVHMCLENTTESCEQLSLSNYTLKNFSKLLSECQSKFCTTIPCSNLTLCSNILQVDLETNKLRDFPTECNFTAGFCAPIRTIWEYSDRCKAVHEVTKGYEKVCGKTKCVLETDTFSDVTILRKGKLCDEDVWYTDIDGVVAASSQLQFRKARTGYNSLKKLVFEQDQEIDNLQTSIYCLLCVALLFILWYFFNVLVNCVSIIEVNKKLAPKDRASVVNCISQALAVRHLYSFQRYKQEGTIQAFELYESVTNDFYSKPP